MSLNIHNVSFGYPAGEPLFENVSIAIADGGKTSLIGDNGTGKSTLLKIITGELQPLSGEVSHTEGLWFVPQHFGQYDKLTVAGALGIEAKLRALETILVGSFAEEDFAALADDWDIAQRAESALREWGLDDFGPGRPFSSLSGGGRNADGGLLSTLDRPFNTLSGGEKTRVFLAGIALHSPALVVMDEPTNHLDAEARRKLYAMIGKSRAAMLIVSHDRTLLDLMDTTWELTSRGAEKFGGNYTHYREVRDARLAAMAQQIAEKEKALRTARQTARETLERQQRSESRGGRKAAGEGIPRIMLKTLKDSAAATTSRLRGAHSEKVGAAEECLREKRAGMPREAAIRIKLSDSALHTGKTLVEGQGVNFSYGGGKNLWDEPFDFRVESGERIVVRGGNGSGKTTLARLILGELQPTEGEITRADARILYMDQQYSLVDGTLTVAQQAAVFNTRNLPAHIVKTELHRFLFPAGTWDKPCGHLSGGEKMKLVFCSLLIGDSAPDAFILDEPTNNLDIRSLELITAALKDYGGTVVVISHDARFLEEIGVTREIVPGRKVL